MITVNGEKKDFSGKTVAEVLVLLGYNQKRIATEINENILPKSEYDKKILNDGDKLEIVRFVGGG